MKFLRRPEDFAREFRRLINICDSFYGAVAWASTGFDASTLLLKQASKIRRLIVGVHFHQTSPEFIKAFSSVPNVRYRLDNAGLTGTFHPKLFFFQNQDGSWEAIIGSANFTKAAFQKNIEYALLLGSGDQTDISPGVLREEIEAQWQIGRHFKARELIAYETRWKKSRIRLHDAAGQLTDESKSQSVYQHDLLNLEWPQYVDALRAHPDRFYADRLHILREANKLWKENVSFTLLGEENRKKIAGFASEKQERWRLFGSMKGAIAFKALIRDKNRHLLRAPDRIPLSGTVERAHFLAFVADIKRAGINTLGISSRLLCLRRPDYFVCINQKNPKLLRTLGVKGSELTLDNYWDKVVARLLDTPWWNSPRPTGNADEQTIWHGRVAMVDSLFYEGHG